MSKKSETVVKKEFNLEQAFAMWKNTSKKGLQYFSGKLEDGTKILGYYNTKKKNPKEPDIRIYKATEEGIEKEALVSLWCNVTKSGKKLLGGKFNGKDVIGFINEKATEKQPYFSVYYKALEEAKPVKKAEKKIDVTAMPEDVPF